MFGLSPCGQSAGGFGGAERFPETVPANGGYRVIHSFVLTESGDYLITLTKADHTPSTNYAIGFTVR